MEETYLEDKDLSGEEESVIRMLYYENRILLEDVADLLGPMEAMRTYLLKDSIDREPDKIPEPSNVAIPSDEEIPDEVLDEVDGDFSDEFSEEE